MKKKKGQMQIVSKLSLCVCKPDFVKLTVDYSEDQRSQIKIALSAINNAFNAHSNDIQDIVMSLACNIGTDSLYSCILTATVQHSPQDSRSSGPESSVYSLPISGKLFRSGW